MNPNTFDATQLRRDTNAEVEVHSCNAVIHYKRLSASVCSFGLMMQCNARALWIDGEMQMLEFNAMLELLPSSTAALQTAARTARSRSRTPLRNPGEGGVLVEQRVCQRYV